MSQLGFDPATIGVAITTGKSLMGLLGQNPKDKERFAANAEAFRLALPPSMSQTALEFLKYRSGRFGTAPRLGPPYDQGPIGGWATQAAKDDAWGLYQRALGSYGMSPDDMPGGGGGPPTSGGIDYPDGGGYGLPPINISGQQSYTPLLVGAAVLAVAAAMSKRRRT